VDRQWVNREADAPAGRRQMRQVTQPLLAVAGLSKTFPGLKALIDVDFAVCSGEIVALVGQNGSGKSTLVKMLTGIHEEDPGARVTPGGQADGAASGLIHVIHQDLRLIPQLNTVENLDLGRRYGFRAAMPIRRRAEIEHWQELLRQFDAMFDVTAPVGALTPAERTIVAIARPLDGWEQPRGLLILDEPTAALHSGGVDRLFTAVRRVASRGAGWSLSRIASTRLWTLPIASWFLATAAWPLTRRSGNSTTLSWFG
jgi:ABC-type sugar transport system ATPase subunit